MTPYIDMHCDTLIKGWVGRKKDITIMPKAMLDIDRLIEHGVSAQFFAVFMPPIKLKKFVGPLFPKDEAYAEKAIQIFNNTIEKNSDVMALAKNAADLQKNMEEKKLSAFLTFEDGRAINGSMEKLEEYYNKGIRLISLTWNQSNCFGAANSNDPEIMSQGLTSFGKSAIERMNELGIIIDVSHLSDGGFKDVAELSKVPFVASHSNCRALSPHRRNLTDEMIKTLANKGGVAGLNFAPQFLNEDIKCKSSRVDSMINHIKHMSDIGGIECVGIGTDFDGIGGELEIDGVAKMHLLFERLEKEGFTNDQIEKFAFKNTQRVITEVMK